MRHKTFHDKWGEFRDRFLSLAEELPQYQGARNYGSAYTGIGRVRKIALVYGVAPDLSGKPQRDKVLAFKASSPNWDGFIDWVRVEQILKEELGAYYFDDPKALYWDLGDLRDPFTGEFS